MKIKLFAILLSLAIASSRAQVTDTMGFYKIKNGDFNGAVETLYKTAQKEIANSGAFPALDSLYALRNRNSEKNIYNYLLGMVLQKLNYKYNAYIFFDDYLTKEPAGEYADSVRRYIDKTEESRNILKYFLYWENYQNKLYAEGKEKARTYWEDSSANSLVNYDNNNYFYYHAYIKNQSNRKSYLSLIKSVDFFDSYVQLNTVDKWGGNINYFTQGEDYKLIAPCMLFIRGGKKLEVNDFIYYCVPGEALPDNETICLLSKSLKEICNDFNVELPGKIRYIKCNSRQQVGKLLNLSEAGGYAVPENLMVVASRWNMVHEITHIVARAKYPGTTVTALTEGIAVYYGGTASFSKNSYLAYIQSLSAAHRLPSIDSLLNEKYFYSTDACDSYTTMGAFIKYLVDTYGKEKFLSLFSRAVSERNAKTGFNTVFGKDLPAIENEFHQWLQNLDINQIKPVYNENAQVVFAMEDAEGDDNGDGTYQYPAESKIKKGIFDLTNFKVSADSNSICFEIKLKEMADYNLGSWGFYRTFINISIIKDTLQTRSIEDICWDVNAAALKQDIWFEVSDIGITLWDAKYKNIIAASCINTFNKNYGDTVTKCIRFSVPINLIGRPNRNWRYIVGTACRDTANSGFINSLSNGSGYILNINKAQKINAAGNEYKCNFYDVLLPPQFDQKRIFNSYDTGAKKKIVIPYAHGG